MNLFGINQIGVLKDNNTKGINKKFQYKKTLKGSEPAIIELGNPDLRESGIYRPQMLKNIKEIDQRYVRNMKAETLRSIVEKMMYKQASSDSGLEKGYWSAESTSQRVLELAKALAADDLGRVKYLKLGFIKGFNDARILNGGILPQVCNDTYEQTMEAFDSWMDRINLSHDARAK